MVSLTSDEEDVIQSFVECLAHAVTDVEGIQHRQLNKTIIQKFVYLGAKEFDVDLTYSWYLAGSLIESRNISEARLEAATPTLGQPTQPSIEPSSHEDDPDEIANQSLRVDEEPKSETLTDIQWELGIEQESDPQIQSDAVEHMESFSEETFGMNEAPNERELPSHPDIPLEECITYFEETLSSYQLRPTDRFLQQFYSYHAPAEFRELYVNCLHVRSDLRAATHAVESLVSGEASTSSIERIAADLSRHVSMVHMELNSNDHLSNTLPLVVEGTDIIEDAMMKLTTYPPEDLHEEHVKATHDLQSFYFEWVWKYPALKISAETATGPVATKISDARQRQFNAFPGTLSERYEEMREELDAIGLLPGYEEYPELDRTELNQAIVDFTNAYVDE